MRMATSLPNAKVGAIIVAAGASSRMGAAGDKTLADLGGEPLIARTVDVFERCAAVACVALVVSERNRDAVAALREEKGWRKTAPPVLGGARRQDSVRAGLEALPKDCGWVVVHDGARPFVTQEMIEAGLEAAHPTGAAVAVVPAFDTVKRVAPDGGVVETLDRSELRMAQTPQVFRRDVLERAHAEVADDATDDAAMAEHLGVEVRTFAGARANYKITTAEDLEAGGGVEGMSTARIIRELHGYELGLLNSAFAHAADSLQDAPSTNDDLNEAMVLLAGKIFNGLYSAILLLSYGRYDQSMTLIRSSLECKITALHAKEHPETIKKVLEGKAVNFYQMATDLGQVDLWRNIYKTLSHSAHPSGAREQEILSSEGTRMLPVGNGNYDQFRVVHTLQDVVIELLNLRKIMQWVNAKFRGGVPASTDAAWQELLDLDEYLQERYPHCFVQTP